jgi:hypothetical protein
VDENFDFLVEVDRYRKGRPPVDAEAAVPDREHRARYLLDRFIKEGAPREVNIGQQVCPAPACLPACRPALSGPALRRSAPT